MSNPSIPTSISNRTSSDRWLVMVLIGALVTGVLAFCVCNFLGTHEIRKLTQSPNGELEWLRREFNLNDTQFKNVEQLQAAYAPSCNEMCSRIMEANAKVARLISENREMTPGLEAAIREAGIVQLYCQTQTLAHIYRVSAQMNPTEGQRYLRMMTARVVEPGLSSDTAIKPGTE